MNLEVSKNSGLAAYSPQQGLGGFWGKIGKWASKAVGYIGTKIAKKVDAGFLGDLFPELKGYIIQGTQYVQNQIEQWTSGMNGLRGVEDGNITALEEAILNNWLPYFTLYAESLLDDVGNALNLPTLNSKLIALNAVLNKINALNAYYLVDDVEGLSQLAREQRSYVVYTSLDPIVKAVQMSIGTLGFDVEIVPIEFNINIYDFSVLFTSTIVTTVKSENYRKKGIRIAAPITSTAQIDFANVKLPVKTIVTNPVSTPATTTVATPVAVPTSNLPVFTIPTNSSTTVTTPVATTTQVTTPVATTPVVETPTTTPPTSTTTTTNNNSNTVREVADDSTPEPKNNKGLIIGGLLLLGAAAIALRKKKVAKKATTPTKKK
ncbi:LPXTG cell wall anchor domain-containing protein [Flavobacterium sp. AG291]|uniref:LPXTG cell wall anchor domain-containing protein n=1 Tax=Flavobacterium sp. AG291 TaxID=2184000 RepID=UPI000E0C159B|nr:LPXTG cell wall anchor domain-containing protein [Flavobacterium sp. AG291]RDI07051.1 LPXTG-motif cell wall-anchored protein [Flavobacterium sp. AG291]